MMCKGETVQRSYLLKYAAKLRITEQACKWTFVGFSGISPTPEAVLRVLQSLFGCLGIQWRNMCFFTESSRWSPLFRRPSTCYIRKHLTHSSYYSPDFVLCIRVICRMWARLRSSLWEKDDFPSSKPPIASAMISN